MRRPASRSAQVAAMLVLPLSACAQSAPAPRDEPSGQPLLLEQVRASCLPAVKRTLTQADPAAGAVAGDFLVLGPNHLSLTVANPSGSGPETAPATVTAVDCILEETRAPGRVTDRLADLGSLTGRHISSWEDVRVTWSYEPKTGVHAIFRTTSP